MDSTDTIINGIRLKQDGHYWVLSYNGKYVGDLFRTYHPTIPYEVYYKELDSGDWYDVSYIDSQRCNTQEEATAWIREQIALRQPSLCKVEIPNLIKAGFVEISWDYMVKFFGPWEA